MPYKLQQILGPVLSMRGANLGLTKVAGDFERLVLPLDRELGTEDDETWADDFATVDDTETTTVKLGTYSVKTTMDADAKAYPWCTLGSTLDISSFFEQGSRTGFVIWVRVAQVIAAGATGFQGLYIYDDDGDRIEWKAKAASLHGFPVANAWFPLVFPTDCYFETGTFDPTIMKSYKIEILGTNGDILYYDEAHFETLTEL